MNRDTQYERDGFFVLRGALSAAEMAPLQKQWQRVRDRLRAGETADGMKRDNLYVHGRIPAPIGGVFKHPVIVELATRLLGPDVALYFNRLNVKDQSFVDPVHLHQDLPYFNGGANKVNFFLALHDINLNNGAMVFVKGSHKLGNRDRATIDLSQHPEFEVVVPSLRPGDLLIAHILLWHSSVPNTTGADRAMLQMMCQSADDGSYYPLSVPEPTLIAGQWRTKDFISWQAPPAKFPISTETSFLDTIKAAVPLVVKRPLRALWK